MKTATTWIVGIIIVILIIIGVLAMNHSSTENSQTATSTSQTAGNTTSNTVTYYCDAGKSMHAVFSGENLSLTLSDGRSFNLPQVISGSGIRYEQNAGTAQDVTFQGKGNDAFLVENGSTTYDNCVAGTESSSGSTTIGSSTTYTDASKIFSFMHPMQFAVSGGGVGYTTTWKQNATTSGMLLATVIIPKTFEPNTNFSEGKFTVGTSADPDAVHDCLADAYAGAVNTSKVNISGIPFTKIVLSDAGAGNFYETTSYRAVRAGQCYAVEYTIHTTNIGNYSPDQGISQFDAKKVQDVLEGMVQSFKFLQ